MRHAVYPGTFDPITLGHLDIVARARAVFDLVTVAVLVNSRKQPSMDLDTRIAVIRESLAELPGGDRGIEVISFDGLTVELARPARRHVDRARPAGHQRLRVGAPDGPAQPAPGARTSTPCSS